MARPSETHSLAVAAASVSFHRHANQAISNVECSGLQDKERISHKRGDQA